MKTKRNALVIGIVAVFVICLFNMNRNFDVLSRYPYNNEEYRSIIKEKLNIEEINYIIEYAIDPQYFIDYIDSYKFNIYHINEYNAFKELNWGFDSQDIVYQTEELLERTPDFNLTIQYLKEYRCNEVLFYYDFKDFYYPNTELVLNPNSPSVILDNEHTISIHEPISLVDYQEFKMKEQAYNSLMSLFERINHQYQITNHGDISVTNAYLSYGYIDSLSKDYIDFKPGYNYHQTGFAIDIDLTDTIFEEEENYNWLSDVVKDYGFVKEDCSLSNFHIRYIGF